MWRWKHGAAALAVAATLFGSSTEAEARDDPYLGLAIAAVAVGGVVSSNGAMWRAIEGEPSEVWGRTSLAFGGIHGTIGGGLLIASAFVDEDERAPFFIAGGVVLGLGVHGLIWGAVNEFTLPRDDEGIPGNPRPTTMTAPMMFTVSGTF